MREYPEIELDMDFAERPCEVIDGGYDVVIRAGEVDDSRLMSRRIGSYRLALVCSPSYLEQKGRAPERAEDLAGHACLHHRDAATGKLRRWPFASPEMSDVPLPVTVVANATEALIAFAELGMGIACVADFTVHRQLANGSLRSVICGCLEYRGSLRAIWPSSRFPSPKLRAFIDCLVKHGFASSDFPMERNAAGHPLERANAIAPRAPSTSTISLSS
jgi:DNA-binding transcriptional LysR family regulator